MKNVTFLVTLLLLLITIPSAMATSSRYCIDNETLNVTTDINVDGNSTIIYEIINCTYGCSNGECEGSNISGDMSQVWLTYATGIILMILGTIIKIPSLENTQKKSDVTKPNNMMMVVKYIFFFIGLFLVYLSFGMIRRVGSVYGSEGNVTDATDTATMVIMITMILFLILFVVEFIFNIIKWIKERSMKMEESKFGIEEEEE